jgi:SPP1 gp7 family putative phage head morphogenesis protein
MDSVFQPWLTAKFEADRPLIPIDEITTGLDQLETPTAEAIATATANGANLVLQQGRDLPSIDALNWGVGAQIQRHLVNLWRSGYALGAEHGWAEMKAALPSEHKPGQFALDWQTMGAIAALLTGEPGLMIPLNVEQAILQRVLAIAGTYSRDILNQIKGHLISAAVPTNGQPPIPRSELEKRIQSTLNVGKARAETIARNELTYAYNTARVQTFLESPLVTHVRFIAILDNRTSPICRSRNGMIISIADSVTIEANRPPLHHRCRSLLSPVMPAVSAAHKTWVDDPDRQWNSRTLEPPRLEKLI